MSNLIQTVFQTKYLNLFKSNVFNIVNENLLENENKNQLKYIFDLYENCVNLTEGVDFKLTEENIKYIDSDYITYLYLFHDKTINEIDNTILNYLKVINNHCNDNKQNYNNQLKYQYTNIIIQHISLNNLIWFFDNNFEYIKNISRLHFLITHSKNKNVLTIKNLNNLTYLNLSHNQITNIDNLSNLTNLIYLDLSYNQITDIKIISNLINLTYLNLSHNHITNRMYLNNLFKYNNNFSYTELLVRCQIQRISSLNKLNNLETLYLNINARDMKHKNYLVDLLYLNLNYIDNILELSNLINLTTLYIDYNYL